MEPYCYSNINSIITIQSDFQIDLSYVNVKILSIKIMHSIDFNLYTITIIITTAIELTSITTIAIAIVVAIIISSIHSTYSSFSIPFS